MILKKPSKIKHTQRGAIGCTVVILEHEELLIIKVKYYLLIEI